MLNASRKTIINSNALFFRGQKSQLILEACLNFKRHLHNQPGKDIAREIRLGSTTTITIPVTGGIIHVNKHQDAQHHRQGYIDKLLPDSTSALGVVVMPFKATQKRPGLVVTVVVPAACDLYAEKLKGEERRLEPWAAGQQMTQQMVGVEDQGGDEEHDQRHGGRYLRAKGDQEHVDKGKDADGGAPNLDDVDPKLDRVPAREMRVLVVGADAGLTTTGRAHHSVVEDWRARIFGRGG